MGLLDQMAYNAANQITDPGNYADFIAANPNASAGSGSDYAARISQFYGQNPGNLEDYLANNVNENVADPFTARQEATNQYNSLLDKYNQGQNLISSQYNFAPEQKMTAEQLGQLGFNLNPFQGWDKQVGATATNPLGQDYTFVQNPDGTYSAARTSGIGDSRYHRMQINDPTKGADWNDYMNMAITAAVLAGNAYVAPQAIGAAFAPAGAAAGGMDAYMASAGLNPGTFEGAAFTLPEFASASPIGDQPGDYPMPGEDGTASQWKPSNINPDDVTNLLDYNASYANGTSLSDVLNTANNARKAYGLASALSKIGGAGKAVSGTTGGTSASDLSKIASLLKPAQQTSSFIGQIKGNQTPFFGSNEGSLGGPSVYDVSGSNLARANALRKA